MVKEIDLTNPIAAGRTAEIFAWDEKYVLKLYFSHFPDDEAENEAALINSVTEAGVPTPAVVETTTINGRCGFIMERIAGESLLTLLQADLGQAGEYAQMLAELHANLHQYQSKDLPQARDWLARKINWAQPLTDDEKTAVLDHLQTLPEADNICHADFHLDNIIMTEVGPVIIDWCNANRGHPLSDVARTTLMLSKGGLPPEMPPAEQAVLIQMRANFTQLYLDHYFALQPYTIDELAQWHLPVAAARLSEVIPEETEEILGFVRELL